AQRPFSPRKTRASTITSETPPRPPAAGARPHAPATTIESTAPRTLARTAIPHDSRQVGHQALGLAALRDAARPHDQHVGAAPAAGRARARTDRARGRG